MPLHASPFLKGFLICGHKTHGKSYFGEIVLPSVLLSENPTISNSAITNQYDVTYDYSADKALKRSKGKGIKDVRRVEIFAFANTLKKEFCNEFNIPEENFERYKERFRLALFEYSNIKRADDRDYYTKKVADSIKLREETAIVITDFRQPEEYDYLKERFRDVVWTVIRIVDPLKSITEDDPMENKLKDFRKDVTFVRKKGNMKVI